MLKQYFNRATYLRIALFVIGLVFLLGIYPLSVLWPSGWAWQAGASEYKQMILGVYATLGVFLILAARDPLANQSLIWFTVWSSIVHAGIMTIQVFTHHGNIGHLFGDIPALFVIAVVLTILMPRPGKITTLSESN